MKNILIAIWILLVISSNISGVSITKYVSMDGLKVSDSMDIYTTYDNTFNHINDLTSNVKTIVKVNNLEDKESLSDLNLTHIIVETEKTAAAMFKELKQI